MDISKAQTLYAGLKHLQGRHVTAPKLRSRVYCAAMRPTFFFSCETWSLFAEDVRCLEVFNYQCLGGIARIG